MQRLNEIGREAHAVALDKGFWPEEIVLGEQFWRDAGIAAFGVAAEGHELADAIRSGDPFAQCDKPIALTRVEEEIADVILRVCDLAEVLGVDAENAVRVKHEYNKQRERLNGKVF